MSERAKMQLIVFEAAFQEIIRQADYFESAGGVSLADRWGQAVLATIQSLRAMPQRGNSVSLPFAHLKELRRVPVQSFERYGVFYKIDFDEGTVSVIAVLHTSRDSARVLATPRS